MGPHAYLREVPDAFVHCVTDRPPNPPLDPVLARRQHASYRDALEGGGFSTTSIPGDEAHPDCCFVEDTAVVVDGRALATRPGHPSRLGEVPPVAAALGEAMPVTVMAPPARLDGGDVLRVGGRLFVGSSERTDTAGIGALAEFAGAGWEVVRVTVDGVLHLKSAATALDDETLLVEPGRVDESAFTGLRLLRPAPGEVHAANLVRLPDGAVLCPAAAPRTAAVIEAAGFEARTVDVSELGRADGGLTCLSIRVRGE
jgi:dimethylargininase